MKTDEEIQSILRSIIARKRAHRKALAEYRAAWAALADDRFPYEKTIQLRRSLETARTKAECKAAAIVIAQARLHG